MFKKDDTPRATPEYILSQITEEDIFERYLGHPVEYGVKYVNPFRPDSKAGCMFYYNGYKTKFVDHPRKFNEDCFGIVKAKYKVDFNKALQIIFNDFELGTRIKEDEGNIRVVHSLDGSTVANTAKEKHEVNITVFERDWTPNDIKYWKSYGITSAILDRYDVFSVREYSVLTFNKKTGEPRFIHRYVKSFELCYAYKFGKYYKIYQPFNSDYKWTSNVPHRLYQGYIQLPETGYIALVTKSLKDVMCLDVHSKKHDVFGVAPQAESSVISHNGNEILKSRFQHRYSLYDFNKTNKVTRAKEVDRAGLTGAFKMKHLYGIEPLFLTNGRYGTRDYEAKDFSDFQKKFGVEGASKLIEYTKRRLNL